MCRHRFNLLRLIIMMLLFGAILMTAACFHIMPPPPTSSTTPQYVLSTLVNPPGSGTVSPPQGVYNAGTIVTLSASAASGYAFDHWSGDSSGTNPTINLTIDSNKELVANFKPSGPNVKFQSVSIPNNVPQYFLPGILADYTSTFKVFNYGSTDITVNWDVYSTAVGHFDEGTIVVPANSFQTVTRTYYYTVSGNIGITYTLSYNGTVLDIWKGTSYITPPA